MCVKLGVGPFHWWVPVVAGSVVWHALIVLLTLQKVAPLALLVAFVSEGDLVVFVVACVRAFFGALGGLDEGEVAGVMAWSSISQAG